MKWFRMYTEIIDDPKMSKLADDEFRVFTYLLMVAADEEKDGCVPYEVNDLSWRLRFPAEQISRSIQKMVGLSILSENGAGWKFINWGKRQFASDDVTSRVRKFREKKGETLPGNVSETLHETLDETLENRTEQSRTENTSLSSSQMTAKEPEKKPSVFGLCPQQEIVSLYHRILPEFSAVKAWTPERQKHLMARWKEESKRRDLEWWRKYFEYVRESPFLMGNGNKKWQPNLEWLVKKSNLINVIEGKYHKNA